MTSEPDLRRPLTLADFINRLIGIFRVGLWPMLLTAMALIIPAAILSAAQNIFVEAFLPAETDPASLGDVEVSSALWFLCLIVLGSIVSFLLIGLANIAITYQSDQAARNRPATVGEGLSVGWAKMPAYIQMTLIQFVVYFLFALLALGLLWFSAGVTGGDPLAALIGFTSICGLGLLILAPLLYITTRWSLATSCLVIERINGVAALQRSWQLTQGRVWRAFLYVTVLAIITLALFNLPGILIAVVINLALEAVAPDLGRSLGYFVQGIFTIGSFVFLMPAYVLLYYDLRARQTPTPQEEAS